MTNLTAEQLYGMQHSVAPTDVPVQTEGENFDAELLAEIQAADELLSTNLSGEPVPQDGITIQPEENEPVQTKDGKVINLSYQQIEELIEYASTLEGEKFTWESEKKTLSTKEQSLLNQLDKLSSLVSEKDEELLLYKKDPRRKVLDDEIADIAYFHEETKKNPQDKIMQNRLLNSTKVLIERVTKKPLDSYLEEYYVSSITPSIPEGQSWFISDVPTPTKTEPNLLNNFIDYGHAR